MASTAASRKSVWDFTTQMMEVTRDAIWPVDVGHSNVQTLAQLKAAGVSMDE